VRSMRKNASDAHQGFIDAICWNCVLARNGQSSLSQVHMRRRNLDDSTQGKRDSRLRAYKADVGWCLYSAELANYGGLRSRSRAVHVQSPRRRSQIAVPHHCNDEKLELERRPGDRVLLRHRGGSMLSENE
jgi:hypothetical protein